MFLKKSKKNNAMVSHYLFILRVYKWLTILRELDEVLSAFSFEKLADF